MPALANAWRTPACHRFGEPRVLVESRLIVGKQREALGFAGLLVGPEHLHRAHPEARQPGCLLLSWYPRRRSALYVLST